MIDMARAAEARELKSARQAAAPHAQPTAAAKCASRTPSGIRYSLCAVRGQLTVLPALGAGRRTCVAPRLVLNIVLAGEVGLQTDSQGTGHGPPSASVRATPLWEPTLIPSVARHRRNPCSNRHRQQSTETVAGTGLLRLTRLPLDSTPIAPVT